MTMKGIHKHTKITTLALAQRRGVPYEVQRTVCSTCRRLFDEKPVRRAAA
jgi:NMD protein affecting ribosome stability and mRNA decay